MEKENREVSDAVASILRGLEEFESTQASVGMELRLSLAELILEHLRQRGWTQSRLARAAQMKEPFVSRILHSDANCTLDTVGNLLFALGIRAELREIEPRESGTINTLTVQKQDKTDGNTLQVSGASTDVGYRITGSAQADCAP